MTAYLALVLGLMNILIGWLLHGSSPLTSPKTPQQLPPTLVLAHLTSATLWLVIWIAYLATDFSPTLGWIGLALSLIINALGDTYLLTQARASTDGSSLLRRFARLYKNPHIVLHGGLVAPAVLIFVGLAAFGIGV